MQRTGNGHGQVVFLVALTRPCPVQVLREQSPKLSLSLLAGMSQTKTLSEKRLYKIPDSFGDF